MYLSKKVNIIISNYENRWNFTLWRIRYKTSSTTSYINKHLIPIYDKPMIYYSLSILLLAEIKDITIVCDRNDLNSLNHFLKDGEEFGVQINYAVQDSPLGIPHGISSALDTNNYEKIYLCVR